MDQDSWLELFVISATHVIGKGNRKRYPFSEEDAIDMFDYHYWKVAASA